MSNSFCSRLCFLALLTIKPLPANAEHMKKFICGIATLLGVLLAAVSVRAAVNIPLTVNLSEVVVVTGSPQIAVDVGGVTRYAVYSTGTGSNTLTFTLTPQAGDVDLDGVTVSSPIQLNGGTIKDLAGNDATLTFTPPNTSGIKIDYPSLKLDFVNDDYLLSGTHYSTLPGFLTAAGGTFTRASVGTYYDSAGILQTASAGTPRFDHDPVTHTARGILIEESRTNYLKSSGQMTGTGWSTRAGSTTVAAAVTAPDGSGTSYLETKTSGDGYVWQFVLLAPSTRYTYSIFVKGAGSNSTIKLYAWDSVVSQTSPSITVLASQNWTRVSFSFTTSATVISGDYGFFIGTTPIYVWGAQLEAGSFPSSYIPTTSASGTRAADYLTLPAGAWYNSAAGSVLSSWDVPSVPTVSETAWHLKNAAGTDRFIVQSYSSGGTRRHLGFVGGPVQVILDNSAQTGLTKDAFAFAAGSQAAYANGTLVGTSSYAAMPAAASDLRVGNDNGSNYLNGYFSLLKYYPARVADTQLQLLTQ